MSYLIYCEWQLECETSMCKRIQIMCQPLFISVPTRSMQATCDQFLERILGCQLTFGMIIQQDERAIPPACWYGHGFLSYILYVKTLWHSFQWTFER